MKQFALLQSVFAVLLSAAVLAIMLLGIGNARVQAPAPSEDAFEFVAPGMLADESAVASQPQPAPSSEPEPSEPVGGVWGGILTWLFSATGLMLIGQLLRQTGIPQKIPGWARPLIGPLLGMAAAALSGLLGFVPDLSILEGILLGTTAAVMFDSAKEAGLVKSTKGTGRG